MAEIVQRDENGRWLKGCTIWKERTIVKEIDRKLKLWQELSDDSALRKVFAELLALGLNAEDEKVRYAALNSWLDRTLGKVAETQHLNVTGATTAGIVRPVNLAPEEVALLEAVLKKGKPEETVIDMEPEK